MSSLTVSIASGHVLGKELPECAAWLGIPYAAAPVGPLRWRAPQRARSWQGTRDATMYGPASVQTISAVMKSGGRKNSEDCLTLNVFSPAADGKRRPVMVWIHGGGFAAGSSSMFEGSQLAREGDIVVVTINYRLGIFGFVNLDGVAGEAESNLGLRDQIAALEWVRDNISAFGGDPEEVTIAGESAGSISCSLLMVCARANYLYKRAILQSGATNLVHDLDASRYVAAQYENVLPLARGLDLLRSLRPDVLLKAQRTVDRRLPGIVPTAPWFDGDLLPASFEAALDGPIASVPLLAGTCRDESRLFEIVPGWKPLPTKKADIVRLMRAQLPVEDAEAILAEYPSTKDGDRALATDALFRAGVWQFLDRRGPDAPSWLYRFDAGVPLFGALHGLDMTYIWKANGPWPAIFRGGPLVGDRGRLAKRMRKAWTDFVRDGDPGSDWPRFSDRAATKIFDRQGASDVVQMDPDGARRKAWNGKAILPARHRPV